MQFAVPEATILTNYEQASVEEVGDKDEVAESFKVTAISTGSRKASATAEELPEDEQPRGLLRLLAEQYKAAVEHAQEHVQTAAAKLKIRTLWTIIDDTMVVECVLDGGCQFVAMSEECCLRLKLAYDPSVPMVAVSANGSSDRVLGLARNVPVTIPGGITVLLQIYIIRHASYDVLLGRPFESLLRATVENLAGEEQVMTVRCPNTDVVVTIPTYARGEHPAPSPAQIRDFHE